MATDGREQLDCLNGKVGQLTRQGQYEGAINFAIQVSDLALEHFGLRHPRYATSLEGPAGLYQALGNHGAAEPLDRPDYAAAPPNLVGLYQDLAN
jgi:hypothetical protein